MNYKLQKLKKLKSIILFGLTLIFINCQDINESNDDLSSSSIQTVSSAEAKNFLSNKVNNTFSKSLKNAMDKLELDKMTYEELKGSDKFLAVIPFSTNNEIQNDRILLTKINNEIKGVIFSMYLEKSTIEGKFSGKIIINSLDGEFLNGYRAENDIIVSRLVKSNLSEKNNRTAKAIGLDSFNAQSIELDEVIIMNRTHGIPMVDEFSWNSIYGGGGSSEGVSWNSTGGGSSPVPSPAPLNATNPCDKIKEQMANVLFNSKKDELSKKTSQKAETGFSQNKNGPFTSLGVVDANTLNLPTDPNIIGYMHTHIDEFENGKFDNDGNPYLNKAIKMFSPADVGAFLTLVKNAKTNNIPISTVYGAMVSSSGTYELRFTGNPDNILPIKWTDLNNVYKTYFEKGSVEEGFLKFLQDKANISGIELYKINKNGTTTKKTLDTNNKIVDINC